MINHGRTLLLNANGNERPSPSFFLEEYVDPAFRAINLSPRLEGIRRALMGDGRDPYYANYRLRQYMKIVHSTDLESYMFALDPRITYLREKDVVSSFYGPRGELMQGTPSVLYFFGSPSAPGSARMKFDWTLEAESPTTAVTTDLWRTSNPSRTEFSTSGGLTDPIPLAGQADLFVRIGNPVPGSKWLISCLSAPADGLPEIMAKISASGGSFTSFLFSGGAPYDGFGKIWNDYPFFQKSFSAFILAYVYRAEEDRLSGR